MNSKTHTHTHLDTTYAHYCTIHNNQVLATTQGMDKEDPDCTAREINWPPKTDEILPLVTAQIELDRSCQAK